MVAVNEKSDKELSDLFIRMGRFQCIVMAFVLSGFLVFGNGFINVWAGAEYHQSYLITCIFFITLFVPLIQNTGITILQARNQMKFRSLLYLAISTISLAMQIIFSRHWGAIGCAVAIGGALVAGQWIVMNIYYAKSQRLNIARFWHEIGKMMVIPVIFTTSYSLHVILSTIQRFTTSFWGMLLFSIMYILLFLKFSMNQDERGCTLAAPCKRPRQYAPREALDILI